MDDRREVAARTISMVLFPELMIGIMLALVYWLKDESLGPFLLAVVLLCLMQTIAKSPLFMKSRAREDRKTAYIITILSYVAFLILMLVFYDNPLYRYIAVCFSIGCVLLAIINFKRKVSVHCGTVAMVSSICGIVFFPIGLISLLLVPLIIWARVTGRYHELDEALIGSLMGLMVPAVVLGCFHFLVGGIV